MKKFAGLILAAGYSSRMNELKALLYFGNDTAIARQIDCFYEAGVADIIIVVGHEAAKIEEALKNYHVQIVFNERYPDGMFSSAKAGLESIRDKAYDGFFILPVDYPLIQPYTLELLIDKFNKDQAYIVYPSNNNRNGHPPLISGKLINKIIEYNGNDGLRGILKEYEKEAVQVEIGNDTILFDIDTKQEYFEALNYINNTILPGFDECINLYKVLDVPQRVIEHCKKVGEVAKIIAISLREKKCDVNPDLVYYSGLLHDIKKGTPDHAGEAAEIIRKMGYEQISVIIKNHMDINEFFLQRICNESILYYADKIVKETEIVRIQDRLCSTVKCNPYSQKRLMNAISIQDRIEAILETNVKDLLSFACHM